MGRIRKDSLACKVAGALREGISEGRWNAYLPGLRELAKLYEVSVPTVRRAIRVLVDENLVEHRGERRQARICAAAGEACRPPGRHRSLLVLALRDLSQVGSMERRTTQKLERMMVQAGWRVYLRQIDYEFARRPRKSWDILIDEYDPAVIVAFSGREVLAEWATRHGRRIMFCGGFAGETGVPCFGYSLSRMLRTALRSVLEAGHRRVVHPMMKRPDSLVERAEEIMREELGAFGVNFSSMGNMPRIPLWDEDDYRGMIEGVFENGVPDVLLCSGEEEVSAVLGVMMARGLRYPEDVRIVMLGQLEGLSWFSPKIWSFSMSASVLARRLASACECWSDGGEVEEVILTPKFIRGRNPDRMV